MGICLFMLVSSSNGERSKIHLPSESSRQLLSLSCFEMLRKTFTGTWMPAWVPESTNLLSVLLIFCSMVQSTVSSESQTQQT